VPSRAVADTAGALIFPGEIGILPHPSQFWPFIAAFVALVAAGFGAPIPEELPTIGAGVWVASHAELGPLRWLILPICFLGVMTADLMLFGMGRFFGPRLLEWKWLSRFYPPQTREKTERNFHLYGLRVLLFIRWIPAIRSPMFITAGLMRLPLYQFIIADGIALVFGHSLLFFLAYWFGDQFLELVQRAEHTFATALKPLLILTVIGGVAAYFLYHFLRYPVTTNDPKELKELPIIGEKVAGKLSTADLSLPKSSSQPVSSTDNVSRDTAKVPHHAVPQANRNH
jgi:membrane protein DedA with SNARE-associated domain